MGYRQNRGTGRITLRRRKIIALLGGAMLAWPLAVRGQERGRTYRIGALSPVPRDAPPLIALYDELSWLGFVEGQNLQIDGQGYGLRPEQFAEHAAELAKTKVDVIHCVGAAAIRAAQQATATIPILGITDDLVAEDLVRSVATPGGNMTGVSILATELNGKRQELLIELIPGVPALQRSRIPSRQCRIRSRRSRMRRAHGVSISSSKM